MDNRFRWRVDTEQAFHAFEVIDGPNAGPRTPDTEVTLVSKAEAIRDIPWSKGFFHPVTHMKLNQTFSYPEPWIYESFVPHYTSKYIAYGKWGNPVMNDMTAIGLLMDPDDTLEARLEVLPPGEAASFTRKALDKALRQVPEIISIANFLWELREVKSLIPRLEGWKTLPEQFLNLEFGWLPLISDIRKLLTLVAQVNKRVEHLIRVNKRTVTISHQRKFVLIDDPGPPSPPAGEPTYTAPVIVPKTSYKEATVRQHLRVSYDLDLRGADAFLSAMVAALGLRNPLKIIWNAIPFSFAVDWIFNLGSFLDSVGNSEPFEGTIAIRDAYCSASTREFIEHFMPAHYPFVGSKTMQSFSTTLIRGFHRRAGTLEGTIELTGLTPLQLALAASILAVQADFRLPTRRRKRRSL